MEKYPIFSLNIQKDETNFKSVDEIIEHLKALVISHPIATYITIFDHYTHTKELEDSQMMEGLQDAKNLLFCFGKQIPTTKVLAVRPRSIAVSEFCDSFTIDCMEAPNEQLHNVMTTWIKSIKSL